MCVDKLMDGPVHNLMDNSEELPTSCHTAHPQAYPRRIYSITIAKTLYLIFRKNCLDNGVHNLVPIVIRRSVRCFRAMERTTVEAGLRSQSSS